MTDTLSADQQPRTAVARQVVKMADGSYQGRLRVNGAQVRVYDKDRDTIIDVMTRLVALRRGTRPAEAAEQSVPLDVERLQRIAATPPSRLRQADNEWLGNLHEGLYVEDYQEFAAWLANLTARLLPSEAEAARPADTALREALERLIEAAGWCGGSEDFAPDGKAGEGWRRVVLPAIKQASAALAASQPTAGEEK